ncbi:hypothetical protein MMC31_002658, partial [Peltigera leucophlebia]|nr:hypothetical protein [Peltigera leucophlebia]
MAASEEIKQTLSKHASYDDAEGTTMSSFRNTRTRKRTISEDLSSSPRGDSQHLARGDMREELRGVSAEPYSQKKYRYSSPSNSTDSGSRSPEWAPGLPALTRQKGSLAFASK